WSCNAFLALAQGLTLGFEPDGIEFLGWQHARFLQQGAIAAMLAGLGKVRPANGHQASPAHDVSSRAEAVFTGPGAAVSGPFLTLPATGIGEAFGEPGIHMRQQLLLESLLLGLVQ